MAIEQDTPIDSRISLTRSIPGQSLTNDPDDPYPWEKPPEFTDLSGFNTGHTIQRFYRG